MVRIDRVTIAVGDQERMVNFYSRLFQMSFTAIEVGGFTLHRGQMAPGLELQLCPKALAGIGATQNIHQLRFVVDDLGGYLASAVDAGGELIGELTSEGGRRLGSVRDPDGNSLELIAAE